MKKYIVLLLLALPILLSGCKARAYPEDVNPVLTEPIETAVTKPAMAETVDTTPVLSTSSETDKNESLSEMPFAFTENTDPYGFIIRTYYDGEEPVAESFGYEIDDYYIDFDNDGLKELLCNCEYGVDGHREVYVYKTSKPSLKGEYMFKEEDLPGLNYWGVNAVQTFYDPSKKAIIVSYYDTIRELDILLPLKDFDSFLFEKF